MSNPLIGLELALLGKAQQAVYDAESAGLAAAGFGTGLDGHITDNFTAQVSAADVETAFIHAKSINLPAGKTITVNTRCKGLIIYCHGDVVISGTIDMNGKAALASGTALSIYSYNNLLQTLPRGGKGGVGGNGGNGAKASSGGGGNGTGGTGGATTQGNIFGGGPGGGGGGGGSGCSTNVTSTKNGTNGGPGTADVPFGTSSGYVGCGGLGGGQTVGGDPPYETPGGAGACPGGGGGGDGYYGMHAPDAVATTSCPGGCVLIIAAGNVLINAGGVIRANGGAGGDGGNGASGSISSYGQGAGGGGGGGMGGGIVAIAHKGTFVNNGSITVSAGVGGAAGSPGATGYGVNLTAASAGAAGTAGSIVTQQL